MRSLLCWVHKVWRDREGKKEENSRRGNSSSSGSQPGMDGIKFTPHELGRAKSCYIL